MVKHRMGYRDADAVELPVPSSVSEHTDSHHGVLDGLSHVVHAHWILIPPLKVRQIFRERWLKSVSRYEIPKECLRVLASIAYPQEDHAPSHIVGTKPLTELVSVVFDTNKCDVIMMFFYCILAFIVYVWCAILFVMCIVSIVYCLYCDEWCVLLGSFSVFLNKDWTPAIKMAKTRFSSIAWSRIVHGVVEWKLQCWQKTDYRVPQRASAVTMVSVWPSGPHGSHVQGISFYSATTAWDKRSCCYSKQKASKMLCRQSPTHWDRAGWVYFQQVSTIWAIACRGYLEMTK